MSEKQQRDRVSLRSRVHPLLAGRRLGDWLARIAAGEAVIGLFIELILIATFSKRFPGN